MERKDLVPIAIKKQSDGHSLKKVLPACQAQVMRIASPCNSNKAHRKAHYNKSPAG